MSTAGDDDGGGGLTAAAAAANDDIEEVDAMIAEKKALLKKSEDVYEFDRLSAELEALEWLQRQIAKESFGDKRGEEKGKRYVK